MLEDLQDWPESGHWHGRDTAIARLEDVTTALGGQWTHVRSAQSFGEEVLVMMDLRTGRAHQGVHVGTLHLTFEVQQGEIVRIRVFGSRGDALAALDCPPLELDSEGDFFGDRCARPAIGDFRSSSATRSAGLILVP